VLVVGGGEGIDLDNWSKMFEDRSKVFGVEVNPDVIGVERVQNRLRGYNADVIVLLAEVSSQTRDLVLEPMISTTEGTIIDVSSGDVQVSY